MRSTETVGRGRELRVLAGELDRVEGGAGGCVVLVGEPGIGKTHLLHALMRESARRGFRTFYGRASESERQAPFGVLIDALDSELARPAGAQAGLAEELRSRLAGVFPGLDADRVSSTSTQSPLERFEHCRALRSLLGTMAKERPVLLALDDLHWVDPASTAFMDYLLKGPQEAGVLLALALRPENASAELRGSVGRARRRQEATVLALAPLLRDDLEGMIPEDLDLDPGRAAEIYEEGGGNPLYVVELARAARADASGVPLGSTGGRSVPRTVEMAVTDELDSVTDRGRAAARGAAVLGDGFDPEAAGEVAGLSAESALAAIDELLAAGIVRRAEAPRAFRFRHPVVGRVAYDWAGRAWRTIAHRRAASMLAAKGAPLGSRAEHLARSAERGDEEAVACLKEAGHEAVSRAPATAARWFAAALRLLPEDAGASRRVELLVPSAVALVTAGHVAGGRAAIVEALGLTTPEDPELRARLRGSVARVEQMLGAEGARESILAALREAPDERSRCRLDLELGVDHWHARESREMAVCARRARGRAQEGGHADLHAVAAAELVLAEQDCGAPDRARSHLREAESLVAGLSDRDLSRGLVALALVGQANHHLQRYERSIIHLERGLEIARATGQMWFVASLGTALSRSQTALGRLERAMADAEEATEAARQLGDDQSRLWAALARCCAAVSSGDPSAGIAAGMEAVEAGARVRNRLFATYAHCFLGLAYLLEDEAERARVAILDSAGGAELPGLDAGSRPYWYARLTDAELALGRPERARAWVERAAASAEAVELPGRRCDALRARAAFLLASGEPGAAGELAASAAERSEQLGMRLDAGRANLLAGRALLTAEREQEAVSSLERALAQLEATGVVRDREAAADELRRLGVPVRRGAGDRNRSGLGALSERARRVSELVAQGKTNKQIAGELYLGERTVETHLAEAFRTLHVDSRSALAALVAQSGRR